MKNRYRKYVFVWEGGDAKNAYKEAKGWNDGIPFMRYFTKFRTTSQAQAFADKYNPTFFNKYTKTKQITYSK